MKQPAIDIEGLTKRFPKTAGYKDILTFWRRQYTTALDGVDLRVPEGSLFGILGPNGAGKTTLLKILAGLVLPDQGQVNIKGHNIVDEPRQARDRLMYVMGDERTLYWRLTGRQNLRFFAMLNEIPRRQREQRVEEILSIVGLTDEADERVVRYSTGMKQRLAIARGLLSDPEVLLLDEPTRSLDPLSARRIQNFIKDELKGRQGKTIVLATHNMEEATYLCEQVAILHRGKVRACDTVAAVADKLTQQGRFIITVTNPSKEMVTGLVRLAGVLSVRELSPNGHEGLSLDVTVQEPTEHIPTVVEHLVRLGARVTQVNPLRVSLSDAITAIAEDSIDYNQTVRLPVERLGAGS